MAHISHETHQPHVSLSSLFAANKNNFSGESGESALNKQTYFTFSCIREIMFIFATKILAIINRRRLYSARIVGDGKIARINKHVRRFEFRYERGAFFEYFFFWVGVCVLLLVTEGFSKTLLMSLLEVA